MHARRLRRRLTTDQEIVGSTPTGGSFFFLFLLIFVFFPGKILEDATVGRDKPAHIRNPQGHTHVATHGRTRARTRNGAREGGEGAPQDGRGLGNEASYGSSVDETISRPRRPQATPCLQGSVHPPKRLTKKRRRNTTSSLSRLRVRTLFY